VLNDPRDRSAYQLAIVILGLAVVAAVGGVSWAAAEHECIKNIAPGLWIAPGALAGVFVGVLLPLSIGSQQIQNLLTLVCVGLFVCGATAFAAVHPTLSLDVLGATVGGLVLGLPIPSPGRGDP
jgi:uncharacterized membrane protein YfcA